MCPTGSIDRAKNTYCSNATHNGKMILMQACLLFASRRLVQEVIRLKEQGLPIPDHLKPPAKEEAAKGKKGEKGGKADGKKK